MPINFPANPTNGQTYTNPTTNTQYVYSTTYGTWSSNTASTGASTEINPGMQLYRLNVPAVGQNATGNQNTFGVGVTLNSGTIYEFESSVVLNKTAGVTSHTMSVGYTGTVAFNNFIANHITTALTGSAGGLSTMVTNANSFSHVLFSSTGAVEASINRAYITKGSISVSASGTFVPQYSLSQAPGGAYSTLPGSYFAIWPIGTAGANVSIGTWT